MSDVVYTIGHSAHSIEKLIGLLEGQNITAVADVRSHPFSRFNPQFNRESLQAALKKANIAYVFLGRELGARPEDRDCYVGGAVQFDRLARTETFQEGLNRVIDGAKKYRIALLCAEKDPLNCHRAILVCRHLVTRGISVQHILEDGSLESHNEAVVRLLRELGLQNGHLFRSPEDIINEAYNRRSQQIAYIDKDLSPDKPLREV